MKRSLGILFTALFVALTYVPSAQAQAGPALCDADFDSHVDRDDVNLILAARNTPATPGTPTATG